MASSFWLIPPTSRFTEEHLVDDYGVIFASLNILTNKPWTAEDISSQDHYLKLPGFETWHEGVVPAS